MNIYGQGQAFYNDLIYPISPMYSTGLAELLDREVDGMMSSNLELALAA